MKLSVVIVNYNVKEELTFCLSSVQQALQDIEGEVFVVDNHSADGSCDVIKTLFPWVTLIENAENLGFARANNIAIKKSCGEYVLLLNPDTVVEQDTFSKMLAFMDEHDNCGGLGVKMLDAQGTFLPESKRGIPTPWVAFCKLFGLYKLFPKSEKCNRYYLSNIPQDLVAEVEILAGACMLLRKSVLDEVGLLDETYFLYGEDVDISYRILQAGYKNYYFPETSIIHLKGASTKKLEVKSVREFYRSMEIFCERHFTQYNKLFLLFVKIGINVRMVFAMLGLFVRKLFTKTQ
ncbi:MAG: glycosyltransferase family 2 protein [Bacteroidales bacterium]|nr:glycosyltransferase family 2 protein [Bacteroidales bacterium]